MWSTPSAIAASSERPQLVGDLLGRVLAPENCYFGLDK